MDSITEGSVLMLPTGAYVVLRMQHDVRRNGCRVLLRDLEGASLRSIPYTPDAWIVVLQLPDQVEMQLGDIVLYPGSAPERSLAAIRHHSGWMRTAAPWPPFSDVEVCLHISEARARFVRSSVSPQGARRRRKIPLGTVVASRDVHVTEPTVWVRTGEDFWVGSNRGVTASDLMINYELDRRTYQTVWVPEGIRV